MKIQKMELFGNENIGMFLYSTNDFCIVPNSIKSKDEKIIKNTLEVKILKTNVMGLSTLQFVITGNSNGVIISNFAEREEIEKIKKITNVFVVDTKYTALGNLIVCNDKGCVISSKVANLKEYIEDFLSIKTKIVSAGRSSLIGPRICTNNKGCIVSKNMRIDEIKIITNALNIKKIGDGTVNNGSIWIRCGCVVNDNGILIGYKTIPTEISTFFEVLS